MSSKGRRLCAASRHWSVEDNDACFIVRDHGGQKLAYVYYEEERGPTLDSEDADTRRGAMDCS